MRYLWITGGFISLGLGVIGIVLPILPTVPFLLLSAFLFSKSSARLSNWILNHKTFGPPIQDWQKGGAIGKTAKVMAVLSIIAAFGISYSLGVGTTVLAIQAAILSLVLLFILTRPNQ